MNINEIWKPVVGYEGLYEVSSFGRLKRIAAARGTVVGYIFTPSLDTKGYLRTRITDKNGKCKTIKMHRVVAEAFLPNPDNLPIVNHINGITTNNYVSNLEWCTHAYNMQHSFSVLKRKPTFLNKFGGDHNRSVRLKAFNIDTGERQFVTGINEAARKFKTNASAIWRTIKGEYKHTKRWRFEYA